LLDTEGNVFDIWTSEEWDVDCVPGPAICYLTITDTMGCTVEVEQSVDFLLGTGSFPSSMFKIYPNPSSGTFRVSSDQAIAEICIFDSKGAAYVRTIPANDVNLVVDGEDLSAGLYVVKVVFNNGSSASERLIIFDR
jgi:hypothetical protein